jgi:hypothetical protein
MWSLWWTKRHWRRFSPSTSFSPANHSTDFSIIIITRGGHNRPIDGRSAEWTQLDSTPHYTNLKKLNLRVGRPSGRSSSPGGVRNSFYSTSSRPALGSTQSPIKCAPGALSPGIKRQGREADHSTPASSEVKKMWIYTTSPLYTFMA